MTQNTKDAGASNEIEHVYREATKPRPETSGVGEYCQPGDRREPRWIVMYDDADRSLSIFEDEQDARDCFANSEAMGWNCWLFSPTSRVAPTAEQAEGVQTQAARDVLAERLRQVTAEGWTPEHDDAHDSEEMAIAAACYAESAGGYNHPSTVPSNWPWASKWWKSTTPRRDLVKAGALILAEIERIDRAASSAGDQS